MVHSELDSQLLTELRDTARRGRAVPVALLRVLAVRGWVHVPNREDVVEVKMSLPDGDLCEELTQEVASANLTRHGERELALHARMVSEDELDHLLALDNEEPDEWAED